MAAPEVLDLHVEEPRAFGWQVGDVLRRRVQLEVPPDWALDEASLPRVGAPAGPQAGALVLRRVTWADEAHRQLELDYQILLAPPEPRQIELPIVALGFDPVLTTSGAASAAPLRRELRLQPWPVVVVPLTPEPPPATSGLGEMRPDAAAPRIDTRWPRRGLALGATLSALAALALLLRPWVLRVLWRRRQPFAQAWRAVAPLPAEVDSAALDAAFRQLHTAFNTSAGRVLAASEVPGWVQSQPFLRTEAERIAQFYAASQARFFGVDGPGWTLVELRALAQRLHHLEAAR